jgi:hypothetical protein
VGPEQGVTKLFLGIGEAGRRLAHATRLNVCQLRVIRYAGARLTKLLGNFGLKAPKISPLELPGRACCEEFLGISRVAKLRKELLLSLLLDSLAFPYIRPSSSYPEIVDNRGQILFNRQDIVCRCHLVCPLSSIRVRFVALSFCARPRDPPTLSLIKSIGPRESELIILMVTRGEGSNVIYCP